jgi:hypothetical protein
MGHETTAARLKAVGAALWCLGRPEPLPSAPVALGDATARDPALSALGAGAQQAIALAQALGADLLHCDDRDARQAALMKNLRVGTAIAAHGLRDPM